MLYQLSYSDLAHLQQLLDLAAPEMWECGMCACLILLRKASATGKPGAASPLHSLAGSVRRIFLVSRLSARYCAIAEPDLCERQTITSDNSSGARGKDAGSKFILRTRHDHAVLVAILEMWALDSRYIVTTDGQFPSLLGIFGQLLGDATCQQEVATLLIELFRSVSSDVVEARENVSMDAL